MTHRHTMVINKDLNHFEKIAVIKCRKKLL